MKRVTDAANALAKQGYRLEQDVNPVIEEEGKH
jgi:hypothetical protein